MAIDAMTLVLRGTIDSRPGSRTQDRYRSHSSLLFSLSTLTPLWLSKDTFYREKCSGGVLSRGALVLTTISGLS